MPHHKIEGIWYEANSYLEARTRHAARGSGDAGPSTAPLPSTRQPVRTATIIAKATPKVAPKPAPVFSYKPVQSAANTRLAPPQMTISTRAAAATPAGKIRVVHRADSRSLDHTSIIRDRGFGCQSGQWQIREKNLSRKFIEKLLKPAIDVNTVNGFGFAKTILTPTTRNMGSADSNFGQTKVTLLDISAAIKRILKDSRAFWVSTSENKECGGYATSSTNNVYRFTLPVSLTQYELILGDTENTLKAVQGRTSAQVPTICFDGSPDGSSATVVAINSGPLDDVEISFLTSIKLGWVEVIERATA